MHEPHSFGLAILSLDGLQRSPQRGLVGGIAGEDFVTQGEPFGGHDQGQHHLLAIGAMIPTITVFVFSISVAAPSKYVLVRS